MNCGLLGRKLAHSYSPQIHNQLGDYRYQLFEKEPEALEGFLKSGTFDGINVTIPYKKDVMAHCHQLSDVAAKIGAVNTIVCRDGRLIGHNTDYFGFRSMVLHSGLVLEGKKVLVLGTGGASVTAQLVLQEMGADVVVISRRGENNYSNLDKHKDARAIVNCTPVGMYPDNGLSPVDLELFPVLEGVLDLVYNPAKTQLLLDAQDRGIVAENGLWMLVAQAKESAEWFTDRTIDDDVIASIHASLSRQMKNIVLIGMPGCGKSTVAKLLGEALGREVLDADAVLTEKAGCSIPHIFANQGEDAFRKLETQVLKELGKLSGKVIATGGGCVTRPENYNSLRQNATVVWLQRSLSILDTAGRPLSQKTKAEDMYKVREPLYKAFSDFCISNDSTPEQAAQAILERLR